MPTLLNIESIRNKKCKLCPTYETANHVCLIGKGPKYPKLMFVGESPGEEEDQEGEPFIGKAGKILNSVFNRLGIIREETFITNAIKCHPLLNSKPNTDCFNTCTATYLRKEIELVQPQLIICLGVLAARALLQEQMNIVRARNNIWYTKGPLPQGIPFIVTYHPAATFHIQEALGAIIDDLRWAQSIVEGTFKKKKEKNKYKKIDSISKINLDGVKWIDIDTESDGLDPFKKGKELLSIQISTSKGKGYYLDWSAKVALEIRFLFDNPNLSFNGHNLKHDLKWLHSKAGVDIFPLRINDTIQNIHLLDENFPDKSLDTVSTSFTNLKGHKNELVRLINEYVRTHKRKKEKITKARSRLWAEAFKSLPGVIRYKYACGDADATGRLRRYFLPRLKEEGLYPLHKLMMETTKLITEAECHGIKIDLEYHKELKKIYKKKVNRIYKELAILAHDEEMNHRSNIQLKHLFYIKWKCISTPVKSGRKIINFSTGKDALDIMLGHEKRPKVINYIKKLMEYRKESKLYGTYIKGLSRFLRSGYIHATWNLTGADTGRSTCKNPNLQQLPRSSPIKGMFVSRFDDGELGQLDASQGELRIMAHAANIKRMIQHFKEGRDIHAATASDGEGIRVSAITEEVRYRYKQANFSIGFGSGVKTAAREMETSVENAARVMANWNRTYPEWKVYAKGVEKFLSKHGYVETLFHRRRRLNLLEPYTASGQRIIRQAINATIQGSLVDYCRLGGVALRRRIQQEGLQNDILILGDVHDSWWFDYRRKYRKKLYQMVKEEFENPDTSEFGFTFKVPMKVDFKYGPNLKDMKELKD